MFRYRLVKYLPHSRNVSRVRDLEQRCNLMKSGKLSIVSFLSELPATQHDFASFAVDMTVYTVMIDELNTFTKEFIMISMICTFTASIVAAHRYWHFPWKSINHIAQLIIPSKSQYGTAIAFIPTHTGHCTERYWLLYHERYAPHKYTNNGPDKNSIQTVEFAATYTAANRERTTSCSGSADCARWCD